MPNSSTKHKLFRNFRLMFWVQALLEVKVINVISTLFYLFRGLSLSQIFYTAVIYSLVSLLSEIPSSYLADRWGRKRVIILAVLASCFYWIVNIFAWSFPVFAIAIALYAFANALMSGTDEAMIYDTSKELGLEQTSLKNLGKYYSAKRIFKIIMPLVAVLLASSLTNSQYILILSIDVVATFVALILSLSLVEPHHHLTVDKIEAGIIKDALKLFRNNPNLMRIMFNKSLLFISTFVLWRISSDYFVSRGIPLLYLGFATMGYQFIIYITSLHIDKFLPHVAIEKRVNYLNLFAASLLIVFLIVSLQPAYNFILLAIYTLSFSAEMIRWPLFSQIINEASSSYNRATSISLANFVKSILDIPILFLASYLVSLGYPYLFAMIATLALVPTIVFRLRPNNNNDKLAL